MAAEIRPVVVTRMPAGRVLPERWAVVSAEVAGFGGLMRMVHPVRVVVAPGVMIVAVIIPVPVGPVAVISAVVVSITAAVPIPVAELVIPVLAAPIIAEVIPAAVTDPAVPVPAPEVVPITEGREVLALGTRLLEPVDLVR
jgi:hypothetical protein